MQGNTDPQPLKPSVKKQLPKENVHKPFCYGPGVARPPSFWILAVQFSPGSSDISLPLLQESLFA